ncbi:MAG: sulfotransferase family protein, partial [Chthoniobacteraceae bacterium]
VLERGCRVAARLGVVKLDFGVERLIAEAKASCGLSDFGGEEFREPLRRLLDSCEKEAGLNSLGRMAVRHDVLQLLRNRLRITEARRVNPQIAERRIEQPLFITGLPRTGTTLLHNLLAQDPANRAPLTWEAMFPSEADGTVVTRIGKARADIQWLHRLAPGFRAIHAVDAELPQECVALMSHAFLSDQFDIMYRLPGYVAWLEAQDLRPAYDWHRRLLQHLQGDSSPHWVLKAPAHLQSLDALLECYPDARVVQTHREPTTVLASVASLTALLRSVFSEHVDRAEIGRELAAYWAGVLERFHLERQQHDAGRFCDVPYATLRDDPMSAIRRLYAWLERELTPEAEARMRRFLAEHPRREHGAHRYSLGQFGLSQSEEERRFAVYWSRVTEGAIDTGASAGA